MNKAYSVIFRISEGEKKMLNELCERFSCNTSELIRDWLRYNHKKVFPAYGKGNRNIIGVKELAPEQYCEEVVIMGVKGKVEWNENRTVKMCVWRKGQSSRQAPLSMMGTGEYKAEGYKIKNNLENF